jgi:Ca2+-binding RTX toxin-like protein
LSGPINFVGAAEHDGSFAISAGAFNDNLLGGGKADSFDLSLGGNDSAFGAESNDTFNLGAALNAADAINGGNGGADVVNLSGNYSAGVIFGSGTMTNVETLNLAAGSSYNLTTHANTVASNKILNVNASALVAGNSLIFNGAAEDNGSFSITGGLGNDTLIGGAKVDTIAGGGGLNTIVGRGGGDNLTGGGAPDTFVFTAVADSKGKDFDTVTSFNFGVSDRFDVLAPVTGIDATIATGTLSTATFNADMTAACNGRLVAGHAVLFTPNAGGFSGATFLVVDQNGAAGYQANGDILVRLAGAVNIAGIDSSDFI